MPVPVFTAGEVLTASAMNEVGLWKVGSKTLSGGATSYDGCFTSDFRNYRILYRIATTSGDPEIRFTLRTTAGGDSVVNYYTGAWLVDTAGTLNFSFNGAYSRVNVAYAAAANATSGILDIFNPQKSVHSTWAGTQINSTGAAARAINVGGTHLVASAFDGFTLTASTGTFTGEVIVYGYRD